MHMALEKEQQFYEQVKDELSQCHEGKFVLIIGDRQLGIFDRPEDAYRRGIETSGNVPMLIKRIEKEERVELIPAMVLGLINAHA